FAEPHQRSRGTDTNVLGLVLEGAGEGGDGRLRLDTHASQGPGGSGANILLLVLKNTQQGAHCLRPSEMTQSTRRSGANSFLLVLEGADQGRYRRLCLRPDLAKCRSHVAADVGVLILESINQSRHRRL